MKKTILLLLLFWASVGFAQLINPADTTGTIITAAIRPNSQQDNIATAYTNEIRGTVHHYQTWAELLDMKSSRLVLYQFATVADSLGKVYQYDGANWVAFLSDGGGGAVGTLQEVTTLGNTSLNAIEVYSGTTKTILGGQESDSWPNVRGEVSGAPKWTIGNVEELGSGIGFYANNAESIVLKNLAGSMTLGTTGTVTYTDKIIAPEIKITIGAATGHILTTDALGNGSWQAPAGASTPSLQSVTTVGATSTNDITVNAQLDVVSTNLNALYDVNSPFSVSDGSNYIHMDRYGLQATDGGDSAPLYLNSLGGDVYIGDDLTVTDNIKASTIELTTGAADGHVLTSNALGVASWQAPAVGGGSAGTFQEVTTLGNTTTNEVIIGNTIDNGAYSLQVDGGAWVTDGLRLQSGIFNLNDNIVFNAGAYTQFYQMAVPLAPTINAGRLYMDEADDKLYFINNTTTYDLTAGAGGGGTFLDLTDVPNTYVGHAGKLASVTSNELGIEFISSATFARTDAEVLFEELVEFSNDVITYSDFTFEGGTYLNGSTTVKALKKTVQSGTKIASFSHNALLGDLGGYYLNTSSAVTISLNYLSSGMEGTLFFEIGTPPSSVSFVTYAGNGVTPINNLFLLGVEPNFAVGGSYIAVKYSCVDNGTTTRVFLEGSQEEY